jgi:hypothetical protein
MFREKGLVNELVDYIKSNLKKGYTKDSLRWALVNQGYSRMEVDKAIKRVDIELADEAPILKTKPVIEHRIISPKEVEVKKKWWAFWK